MITLQMDRRIWRTESIQNAYIWEIKTNICVQVSKDTIHSCIKEPCLKLHQKQATMNWASNTCITGTSSLLFYSVMRKIRTLIAMMGETCIRMIYERCQRLLFIMGKVVMSVMVRWHSVSTASHFWLI